MSTKRGSKVALPALPACVAVKTLNVPAVQIESLVLHFQNVSRVSVCFDALTSTCNKHRPLKHCIRGFKKSQERGDDSQKMPSASEHQQLHGSFLLGRSEQGTMLCRGRAKHMSCRAMDFPYLLLT